MSNYTTLYHISRHGPAKPRPLKPNYLGRKKLRDWIDEYPETAVWLTDDYKGVFENHGIRGRVHAYKVDNGLIDRAGGIHVYDYAREVVFPGNIWKEGFESGDIRYLGLVPENEYEDLLHETRKYQRHPGPEGKRRKKKFSDLIESRFYNATRYYALTCEDSNKYKEKFVGEAERIEEIRSEEERILKMHELEKSLDRFISKKLPQLQEFKNINEDDIEESEKKHFVVNDKDKEILGKMQKKIAAYLKKAKNKLSFKELVPSVNHGISKKQKYVTKLETMSRDVLGKISSLMYNTYLSREQKYKEIDAVKETYSDFKKKCIKFINIADSAAEGLYTASSAYYDLATS